MLQSSATTFVDENNYEVRLEFFSGPMDLLLHLVHRQEVPIEDVGMVEICNQYLKIIEQSKDLDLERAAEYLVVAATLMSIKSQSLLPIEKPLSLEELAEQGEGEGREFYEELRRRLKQYELTKQRAEEIWSRPQLGIDTFQRRRHPATNESGDWVEEEGDSHTLGMYFANLLKRVGGSINQMRIRLEAVSVVGYMMSIVDSFLSPSEESQPKNFSDITQQSRENKDTRDQRVGIVIGSFIAILELVKRGLLNVSQASFADEIQIEGKVDKESGEFVVRTLDSEFDSDTPPPVHSGEFESDKVVPMSKYSAHDMAATASEEDSDERKEANRG